jgi:hypothetical protein
MIGQRGTSNLFAMTPLAKIPLLATALGLAMLLSSCVVDGYAYREPYGGGYYDDDDYYPVRSRGSYYGGYPSYSSSYYGGYPYGYGYPYAYGGGALVGSSYYYRNRYYDNHRHHDHDGNHRRYYANRSGGSYSNRQVPHGDHYHSSQLRKNQHNAMIRRGDSTLNTRTISSRSSSSSKSKGGTSGRERRR